MRYYVPSLAPLRNPELIRSIIADVRHRFELKPRSRVSGDLQRRLVPGGAAENAVGQVKSRLHVASLRPAGRLSRRPCRRSVDDPAFEIGHSLGVTKGLWFGPGRILEKRTHLKSQLIWPRKSRNATCAVQLHSGDPPRPPWVDRIIAMIPARMASGRFIPGILD